MPLANAKPLPFKSSLDFRRWLKKNHTASDGIWLRFFRKNSGVKTVTYAEALDQALCYGWIDGQAKPWDEQSWIQKFTPRRPKSNWSKRNTQHAERLIKTGAMTPHGLKVIEAAQADGRWDTAYASPREARPPADFLERLAKNKKAKAFFETLNKANIYSIVYRLETAKTAATREKRLKTIFEMMKQGQCFHPQSIKRIRPGS